MLIDIHACIGGEAERPWTAEMIAEYQRQGEVDAVLVGNLDAADAKRGGLGAHEADANDAARAVCRLHSGWSPLFWVRPGRFDSHPRVLSGALMRGEFAGALFAPSLNGYELGDKVIEDYLGCVARANAAAFFLITADDRDLTATFSTLTRRFNGATLVIGDPGTARLRAESAEFVRKSAERADGANLLLEMPPAPRAELEMLIKAVGAQRLVFGSRAGRDLEIPLRAVATFRELQACISPADYEAISSLNAQRAFRLASASAPAAATR